MQRPTFHPGFGTAWFSLAALPDDSDGATELTIDRMLELARRDAGDRGIQAIARQLHTQAYNHDDAGSGGRQSTVLRDPASEYAARVWQFARGRVRFVRDVDTAAALPIERPEEAEVLIAPRDLVRMPVPAGDCDDFSMLVAALLLAGGVPCSFVAIAADGSAPDRFSHVYVVAHTAEGDLPLDASHGTYAGWRAPNAFRERSWRIDRMIVPSGFSGLGFQTPTFSTTVTAQAPSWWQDLINRGVDTAQMLLQKPTYRSTGPGGTTEIYTPGPAGQNLPGRQPGGTPTDVSTPSTGISTNMLLFAGLGLVAVMMLSKNR